jgi:hypothetical protein
MTGHGQGQGGQRDIPPLGAAPAVTGNAQWTYYERTGDGSHMYQV